MRPLPLPLLLALLSLPSGSVWTGEEEKPQKDPEDTPWKFSDQGRRDPFTFTKLIPPDPKAADETIAEKGPSPSKIEEIQETAKKNFRLAEEALKNGQPKTSLSACDRGLEAFKELNLAEMPALQELHENLIRLRRAAERLQGRADAEEIFRNMNLKVTGVIAKSKNSMAIVNSKVVAKGDLIEPSDKNQEAILVDQIIPGRVIVRFRGYKMELQVSQ